MTTITQDMKYYLSLINFAEKYGVTKTTVKYKTNRQYFTVGNIALMALLSPYITAPQSITAIPINIPSNFIYFLYVLIVLIFHNF